MLCVSYISLRWKKIKKKEKELSSGAGAGGRRATERIPQRTVLSSWPSLAPGAIPHLASHMGLALNVCKIMTIIAMPVTICIIPTRLLGDH